MHKRVKMTIQVSLEYDQYPESYPAGFTPEQMLEYDKEQAYDSPEVFTDSSEAVWLVSAEFLDLE